MKNKKIVITGGCGFIGANLVYALSKDNEVVVVDDISTGKLENIDDLVKNKEVTLIKGDIRDLDLLKKTCSNTDYIFHLASIPSVIMSVKEPELTNEVNVTGTMNVLIGAKENDVKGAKICGSGGGGCILFYSDNIRLLKEKIKSKARIINFKFDFKGFQSWKG